MVVNHSLHFEQLDASIDFRNLSLQYYVWAWNPTGFVHEHWRIRQAVKVSDLCTLQLVPPTPTPTPTGFRPKNLKGPLAEACFHDEIITGDYKALRVSVTPLYIGTWYLPKVHYRGMVPLIVSCRQLCCRLLSSGLTNGRSIVMALRIMRIIVTSSYWVM